MDANLARRLGLFAFAAFLGLIPLANWMVLHVGTACLPRGPCVLPVAPGLLAPSGVITAGAALVLRDIVQRCLGRWPSLIAIAAGSLLSASLAPASLVLASASAFTLSELADFAVYSPLQRRRLMLAVLLSAGLGLTIDSVVFLWLAFGSLAFLPGQVVGKAWAVLFSIPFIRLLRRLVPTPA
ncbi:MAG: VUT family protein [Rhodospirillales bacterium]|nr:VUT family protein [Rhodospirillales bacterium]